MAYQGRNSKIVFIWPDLYCREKIRWLIETADMDNDKYIDREEFLMIVENYSKEFEEIQWITFLKYMRVAAYADEYRWVEIWYNQTFCSKCQSTKYTILGGGRLQFSSLF